MKFMRNFHLGRNHLVRRGTVSLCGVKHSNKFLPIQPAGVINEVTTCHECLKRYDEKWITFLAGFYKATQPQHVIRTEETDLIHVIG